jgi:hypothetical protein
MNARFVECISVSQVTLNNAPVYAGEAQCSLNNCWDWLFCALKNFTSERVWIFEDLVAHHEMT